MGVLRAFFVLMWAVPLMTSGGTCRRRVSFFSGTSRQEATIEKKQAKVGEDAGDEAEAMNPVEMQSRC